MHGMICKAVEAFVRARNGPESWARVVRAADLPFASFETMDRYGTDELERVLRAISTETGQPVPAVLEDAGTWICTDPAMEPVRRLFRFMGPTFLDLLYALDEVHERARMAVPDLEMPVLSLTELGNGRFRVATTWSAAGAGPVIVGIIRALADDYGVLAVVEIESSVKAGAFWVEMIGVHLHDADYARPREFALGGAA